MYHPAPATPAEFAAGFSDEDFEFIEVRNVGPSNVELTDVRFTKGIDFDFPAGTMLATGAVTLVVKNAAAFALRYGSGKPVAGSYGTDALSNGGERLKLSYGAGTTIRDFTYGTVAPWPPEADGAGYSLVLKQPSTLPDHASRLELAIEPPPRRQPGRARRPPLRAVGGRAWCQRPRRQP